MTKTYPRESHEDTNHDSSWSEAPKLSRKVRELAHRSFHAIKTGPGPLLQTEGRSRDVLDDLREVRDEVARLQQKIHERRLDALIPWIDALRRQLDDRLLRAGRTER